MCFVPYLSMKNIQDVGIDAETIVSIFPGQININAFKPASLVNQAGLKLMMNGLKICR